MTEILISRVRVTPGAKSSGKAREVLARLAVDDVGVSVISIEPSLDRGRIEGAIALTIRDEIWGLAPSPDGRSHDYVRLTPGDGPWFAEEFARRLSQHLPRETDTSALLVAHLAPRIETSVGHQLYAMACTALGIAITCAWVMRTWTGVLLGVSSAIAFFASWQLARALRRPTLAFWRASLRLLLVAAVVIAVTFAIHELLPDFGERFDRWVGGMRPRDQLWRFVVLVMVGVTAAIATVKVQHRQLRILLSGAALVASGLASAVLLIDAVLGHF